MNKKIRTIPFKNQSLKRGIILFGIILISFITIIWLFLLIHGILSIKDTGLFSNLNFLAEFFYMAVAPILIFLLAIYKLIVYLKK
jgi:hypothetical protein